MPVETIKDPSIRIKPGPEMTDFVLKKVNDEAPTDGIASLRTSTKKQRASVTLKLEDVRWLNEYLVKYREREDEKIYLHELMETSTIQLPEPEVTPRNPELEARVQKLIAQQNAREYRAMTKEVDAVRQRQPEDTIGYQIKEMNKQLIAVAQFIFSVLAGFLFGFTGIQLIVGNLDFGFRLLLGIICALTVALAEIYFLAKKLNEEEMEILAEPRQPVSKKLHQE